MTKAELIRALIYLSIAAAIWITMILWSRKEEKQARCCRYCTFWFECCNGLGGRCDKHSTAKQPFYTQPDDSCNYYDGFAEED